MIFSIAQKASMQWQIAMKSGTMSEKKQNLIAPYSTL